MVCNRCIQVIQSELQQLGVETVKVKLGEVTVIQSGKLPEQYMIEQRLNALGFELVEDKKIRIVRQVKLIVAEVYSGSFDFPLAFKLSDFLVSKIQKDYNTISGFFSLIEQKTIEQYFIEYRIEKVKELLVYSTASLSDIAFQLNFSSSAHLARQFKQYTGLTTSHFKGIRQAKLDISEH